MSSSMLSVRFSMFTKLSGDEVLPSFQNATPAYSNVMTAIITASARPSLWRVLSGSVSAQLRKSGSDRKNSVRSSTVSIGKEYLVISCIIVKSRGEVCRIHILELNGKIVCIIQPVRGFCKYARRKADNMRYF